MTIRCNTRILFHIKYIPLAKHWRIAYCCSQCCCFGIKNCGGCSCCAYDCASGNNDPQMRAGGAVLTIHIYCWNEHVQATLPLQPGLMWWMPCVSCSGDRPSKWHGQLSNSCGLVACFGTAKAATESPDQCSPEEGNSLLAFHWSCEETIIFVDCLRVECILCFRIFPSTWSTPQRTNCTGESRNMKYAVLKMSPNSHSITIDVLYCENKQCHINVKLFSYSISNNFYVYTSSRQWIYSQNFYKIEASPEGPLLAPR